MLHGHPLAKLAFQPQDHLGCQADLRHQHQRPAAHLQTVLDELQEHQRFAAAGHAVEQRRVRGCILQPGQQRVIGGLLLLRQTDWLVLQRDGRIQVDGFVHLAAFQHARLMPFSSNADRVRSPPASRATAASCLAVGLGFGGRVPTSL